MRVVPRPSVMEPTAQTPQFALTEPSPGSKPPGSLIGPSAAPLAVAGMLNAVSVWLAPPPVLVSISLETKAGTLFSPPSAEVHAPANPSPCVAGATTSLPLQLLFFLASKRLGPD